MFWTGLLGAVVSLAISSLSFEALMDMDKDTGPQKFKRATLALLIAYGFALSAPFFKMLVDISRP